jgi:hypothetical protein
MEQNFRYKKSLIKNLEREWGVLVDLMDRLTPEQMTTPDAGGWTPKDNLAHITEWLKVVIGYHVDRRPAHEVMNLPEPLVKNWNGAEINKALFDRNITRSASEITAELKQTYAELIAKIEAAPLEELMKPRHADDPDCTPVSMYFLWEGSEHFKEHRENIEKGLKK